MRNKQFSKHGHFPQHRQWLLLLLLFISLRTYAHEQPTTLVVLDVAPAQVTMDLHVPLTELEPAFGNEVSVNPEATLPRWQAQFKQYLLDHIRPVSSNGQPWSVTIADLQLQQAEQLQSGKFQEILMRLLLTPPAGASTRRFTLHYDVILHQVVTHKALVSIRGDWERGQNDETQVGVIRVDTATSKIAPFEINLAGGSWRGAGWCWIIFAAKTQTNAAVICQNFPWKKSVNRGK
jgi:hypothetical protein